MSFYFLFLFTLILTNYLLFIQVIYEISDKDGGDDEIGLEWRCHAFVTSSTRPVWMLNMLMLLIIQLGRDKYLKYL